MQENNNNNNNNNNNFLFVFKAPTCSRTHTMVPRAGRVNDWRLNERQLNVTSDTLFCSTSSHAGSKAII
ncbi:hypothetical protein EYF80_043645 [Liparis tanakae]|uniref:Uncharacterized protein n=1 Tax=Liparis tanakae TaxID=230148 RepID=A0A4Z2FZ14_9TELE|nr:hypothetical protein EYF80_043645 [Liparis tanakae]